MAMDMKMKGMVSKVAGVLILLLDLYWTWAVWSAGGIWRWIGVAIAILTLIWLWADM